MRVQALAPFRGALAAAGLTLLLACSNQEPEKESHPGLVSLSLLQARIAFGEAGFSPRPLPFEPEVFHPDSLRYTAKAFAGEVAVFLAAPPRHGVEVTFNGATVTQGRWTDGRPCYVIGAVEDGAIGILVTDSADGRHTAYSVALDVKSLADPESPTLGVLSLEQVFYFRSVTYGTPKPLTPKFHPDSLEYTATLDSQVSMRMLAAPSAPGSEVTLTLGDSILQPSLRLGDTAYYSHWFRSASRFKATVKDILSGKSRTYTLSIGAWTPVNTGEWKTLPSRDWTLSQVDFVDGKTGFAAISPSTLLKTTDGAETWSTLPSPPLDSNSGWAMLDFVDARTGFLLDAQRGFSGTTDGGAHWTPLTTPEVFMPAYLQFLTARIGYVGDWTTMYRTSDGGVTWNVVESGARVKQIAFLTPSQGFACGDNGKVVKTQDGGDTWEDISGNLDSNLTCGMLVVPDSKTLYVSDFWRICRSVDGGRTWSDLELPDSYRVNDLVFTDSRTGYLSGGLSTRGTTILKTEDGGVSWRPQYSGNEDGTALEFPEPGVGYAFGYYGGVLKLSD